MGGCGQIAGKSKRSPKRPLLVFFKATQEVGEETPKKWRRGKYRKPIPPPSFICSPFFRGGAHFSREPTRKEKKGVGVCKTSFSSPPSSPPMNPRRRERSFPSSEGEKQQHGRNWKKGLKIEFPFPPISFARPLFPENRFS